MAPRRNIGTIACSALLSCALCLYAAWPATSFADEPAESSTLQEGGSTVAQDSGSDVAEQGQEEPGGEDAAPETAADAEGDQENAAQSSAAEAGVKDSPGEDGAKTDGAKSTEENAGKDSSASSAEAASSAKQDSENGSASSAASSKDSSPSSSEDKSEEAAKDAQKTFDQALQKAESAEGKLGDLWSLRAELVPYFDRLDTAWEVFQEAGGLRAPLEKELEKSHDKRKELLEQRELADRERAQALYKLIVVDEELAKTGDLSLLDVFMGIINATTAESQGYMLEKIAGTHADEKKTAEDLRDNIDREIEALDSRIEEIEDELDKAEQEAIEAERRLQEVIDGGNHAAFAIEKTCSEVRQESKEAIDAVEKLSSKLEGVGDYKKMASEWDLTSNATRSQAQEAAGAWYDALDELGKLENGISYGCGMDFSLEEEAFVAKWGPAIDEFFVVRGTPLRGYGEEMALQAYRYKVDPRLCAAVSIVESSGGFYCIKPHNAWGWGAADSDPYGLASAWSSWEEAIEAWHRGMATSGTGLATASSLSRLGDIYCSTPIWGQKVATLMEELSGYVTLTNTEAAAQVVEKKEKDAAEASGGNAAGASGGQA